MKANISFSKESLTEAFKLHYNTKFPVRSRMMLVFGVLTLLLGLVFFFTGFPKNPEYLKHIVVLAGFSYIGLYFYRRSQLFKRAAAQKTFQGEFTFELNNKGIAFGQNDRISRCEWEKIEEVIQDEQNILFYFGKDKFYILPLEKLNAEQKTKTQEIINKHHGK